VTPRPLIFVSAVSRELRSARQLVANTLTFLGYQPVWQDIFGTEGGDLRELLRQQIDQCKGVVQLVGQCYGAEPPAPDEDFGRVSYTQYEAFYARKQNKKVWYLFIDRAFPIDPHEPEPNELRELQQAYRERLQADTHVYHSLTTTEGLEASVLKLRDDLTRLRRGVKQWALAMTALLVVIVGLVSWQLHGQAEMKAEIAKLREGIMQYPRAEALVRGSRTTTDPLMQEQIYADLGRQLGVDPKVLREKLPQLADQLKSAPNATTSERANAAYVAADYAEAERLALLAADETRKTEPGDSRKLMQALELAGLSAQRQIHYARAMEHFRKAEEFTDRARNLDDWVTVQHEIADLLIADGKYADAEKVLRSAIQARSSALGPEHPGTLDSRHRLIYALSRETKNTEAETEARDVLRLREKILGPEHADTLVSRYDLGEPLVNQGKFAEAETLYRNVIQLSEKVVGPDHPRTLAARVGLATVLGNEGKHAEAEPLYREIIRLDEKLYGAEYPNTLNDRMNLATTLQQQRKYSEAEAEYRDVIRLDQKMIGAEHPDTLSCRLNLTALLNEEKKFSEAEGECRQIIPLEEKNLGPENQVTLYTRANLAIALIEQGKFAEAQYKDVLQMMERVLGLENPAIFYCASTMAEALARQNKREEAVALCRQLEDHARQAFGENNPSTQKYATLRQNWDRR
jgi:hypothetical protein